MYLKITVLLLAFCQCLSATETKQGYLRFETVHKPLMPIFSRYGMSLEKDMLMNKKKIEVLSKNRQSEKQIIITFIRIGVVRFKLVEYAKGLNDKQQTKIRAEDLALIKKSPAEQMKDDDQSLIKHMKNLDKQSNQKERIVINALIRAAEDINFTTQNHFNTKFISGIMVYEKEMEFEKS